MMASTNKNVALIGDVGGTNIRLQLVKVDLNAKQPIQILKKANFNVTQYDKLQHSIQQFLTGVQIYPETAVLSIAGLFMDNCVELANVPKWGKLNGQQIGSVVKIKNFRFINDFQAASYGVLLVPEHNFVNINGLQIDQRKTRGIIGPGTGLGSSIIYNATIKQARQIFVLPCQAGHIDFPEIDSQVHQYFEFFKNMNQMSYMNLQNGFCGPSFPIIFKFFSEKYPEDPQAKLQNLTSEQIIKKSLQQNAPRIFQQTLRMILKIYGAAIGNFIAHHLCVGGLYLIGSITNSLIPKLKQSDCLQGFKKRHSILLSLINKVPILVCKQIDLGLKGAFYVAQRIIKEES